MPIIKQYQAPEINPRPAQPTQLGLAANEQAARTRGRLAQQELQDAEIVGRGKEQVGALQEKAISNIAGGVESISNGITKAVEIHQNNEDMSSFYAHTAGVEQNIHQAWRQVTADPNFVQNHDALTQKFNDDYLAPILDKMPQGFSTPQWQQRATAWAAEQRERMATVQISDTSRAAGQQFLDNINTARNADAGTLVAQPELLSRKQADLTQMISDLKGNTMLSTEDRDKVDQAGKKWATDNAWAALHGVAKNNPDQAQMMLDRGDFKQWFDAPALAQADNYIKSQKQLSLTQAEATRRIAKQDGEDAANTAAVKLYASAIQPDGSFQPGPNYFKDISEKVAGPYAPPGLVESVYRAGKRAIDEPPVVHSDADLLQHFNERAILPTGNADTLTYQQIFDAQGRGLLSDKDANRLIKDVTEMSKDPARQEAYKQFQDWTSQQRGAVIKPVLPGLAVSPEQYRKWGDLQVSMRQAFDTAYASGKWRDLLNPQSPSYLGQMVKQNAYDPTGYGRGLSISPPVTNSAAPPPPNSPPKANMGLTPEQFLQQNP